jgi:CRISPR-associated protein Cas5t
MPLLRLLIYQPQAHYRIPFTYSRRHSYAIPPYSTIIGFLYNACGIDDQDKVLYKTISELKISISGQFKSKLTEMVWFRNVSREAHVKTYGSIDHREKNGQIGHIGGQSPISIDVLQDVKLLIYLYHKEKEKLETLKVKLENPVDRLQVLHIGRAEDWLVYKSIDFIDDNKFEYKRQDGNYKYFTWIPEKIFSLNGNTVNWDNFDGITYLLTTHSHIQNYENHRNHTGKRFYEKIKAKLNEGKIIQSQCIFDKELNIPVFLGDL